MSLRIRAASMTITEMSPRFATVTVADNTVTDNLSEVVAKEQYRQDTMHLTQFSTLDLRNKCVLVVDDSTINLKMVMLMFKRFGAVCLDASDGNIAVDIVKRSMSGAKDKDKDKDNKDKDKDIKGQDLRIDFVMMDSNMKVMNGPQACRLMREAGYAGWIFGLTGDTEPEAVREFSQSGANFVFKKPIDITSFISTVTRLQDN